MLTVMIWNRNETVPLPASCEHLTVIISSRFSPPKSTGQMKLAKLIGGPTGDSFVFVQCVTF